MDQEPEHVTQPLELVQRMPVAQPATQSASQIPPVMPTQPVAPTPAQESVASVLEELAQAAQAAGPALSGRAPGVGVQFGGPTMVQQEAAAGEARTQQNMAAEIASSQAAMANGNVIHLGKGASALVLIVLGAVITGVGYIALHANNVPSNYVKTTAKVTTTRFIYDNATNETMAQITFQENNHTTTAEIQNGQSGNKYLLGDQINIAYNPAEPSENVKNLSDQTTPVVGALMIGAGALVVLLGCIVPFLSRNKNNS